MRIWISLGTKTDNFEFLDQIYPKKVFPVENRTSSPRTISFCFLCKNIDSTIVFKHFEDPKDIMILNILKEKLVMSCGPGFFYLKIV